MQNFKKYPRTLHLPWSLGSTSDDKTLDSVSHFKDKEIILTLKMDGENTTMYHNGVHARSLDSKNHSSRSWVQNKQGEIAHLIPDNFRICGENLFAKHSVAYKDLPSYFMVFSIWEDDVCLSWKDTELWCAKLGLDLVPVLYIGHFNELDIKMAFDPYQSEHEGYVVRLASQFKYEDFSKSIAKNVRKNHVQTDTHWMHQSIIKNELKK